MCSARRSFSLPVRRAASVRCFPTSRTLRLRSPRNAKRGVVFSGWPGQCRPTRDCLAGRNISETIAVRRPNYSRPVRFDGRPALERFGRVCFLFIHPRAPNLINRCLRCLLLVMCTHPFAKEALTLHLARSEGHERYFGYNLVHRKVLASFHQHLMAEAPLEHVIASVARRRQRAEFPPRRRRVGRTLLSWLSARRYAILFFADHTCTNA